MKKPPQVRGCLLRQRAQVRPPSTACGEFAGAAVQRTTCSSQAPPPACGARCTAVRLLGPLYIDGFLLPDGGELCMPTDLAATLWGKARVKLLQHVDLAALTL